MMYSVVLLLALPALSTSFTFSPQTTFLRNRPSTFPSTSLYGWGPDPVFAPSSVTSVSLLTPEITKFALSYDRASEFTKGGQYVQVKATPDAENVSYLAVSAAPEAAQKDGCLEFIVKKSDSTQYLFEGGGPSSVSVSQPMGSGFKVDEVLGGFPDFPVSQFVLACTGTGISPVLSLLKSGELQLGNGRTAKLYWGVRTKEPWQDDVLSSVSSLGVTCVPVYSNPVESERVGYVQNALEEDGISVPRNTAIVMVGQRGMADAVRRIAEEAGVEKDRVLSNF